MQNEQDTCRGPAPAIPTPGVTLEAWLALSAAEREAELRKHVESERGLGESDEQTERKLLGVLAYWNKVAEAAAGRREAQRTHHDHG
jgi:hypothetical protein